MTEQQRGCAGAIFRSAQHFRSLADVAAGGAPDKIGLVQACFTQACLVRPVDRPPGREPPLVEEPFSLMTNSISNLIPPPGPVQTIAPHIVPGLADLPHDLDLEDPEAVSALREHLRESPELAHFCARFFDSVDPDKSLDAWINLMLYRCAYERQQRPWGIDQPVEAACETVAKRLSPVGQDELLQAPDADAAPHPFSQYLAEAERLYLIGHLFLQRGEAEADPENFVRAAEACAAATQAYRQRNDPEQAAQAGHKTVEAYQGAGLLGKAVEAMEMPAEILSEANSLDEAIRVYLRVIHGYELWAGALRKDNAHQAAEHAYNAALATFSTVAELHCRCAATLLQKGAVTFAIKDYEKAVHHYTQGKRHGLAAQTSETVANIYLQSGQPQQAAQQHKNTARAHWREGKYQLSAQAYGKSLEFYRQRAWYDRLSATYQEIAEAWACTDDPERHLHTANAWLAATGAGMRCHEQDTHNPDPLSTAPEAFKTFEKEAAEKNYEKAVAAWAAAGTPEIAQGIATALSKFADECTANGWDALAGCAYRDLGLQMQAVAAFTKAAGRYWRDNALGDAARCRSEAGKCHMKGESYGHAAALFTEAAETYGLDNAWNKAAEAWQQVAKALAAAGQYEESEAALEKADAAYARLAGC
ncbi:hypothetical protein [Pandoraea oxalativorans]|uniref:hypothetical protein n=1 Tax=Pandoraea oxalativorans TaxID=573737 RepID=UPI0012F4B407|nr:hypothetical protein [Pandoraea oxalativorans]